MYLRETAAKVIQKGCYNWLWCARCKDNTIGIIPRIGMTKSGLGSFMYPNHKKVI